MGKPILYGIPGSPPVRSVLLTAKAIDLDLEFKELNLAAGEHKSKEFLKLNPQHTVPTLDDNGIVIWDSHAIVTYLVGKYGKNDSLYPKDLYQRALVDQRLHFDSGILFPRLRAIVWDVLLFKIPKVSKEKVQSAFEAYDFLERFLDNNLYLVGNTLTVADFCCIAAISSFQNIVPFDRTKYTKLTNWIQRLTELPYYEEANGRGAKILSDLYNTQLQELNKK